MNINSMKTLFGEHASLGDLLHELDEHNRHLEENISDKASSSDSDSSDNEVMEGKIVYTQNKRNYVFIYVYISIFNIAKQNVYTLQISRREP